MNVPGTEISVSIIKKKIKNIYIRISASEQQVRLFIPINTSDSVVERVLWDKRAWIERKLSSYASDSALKKDANSIGDRIIVWGREYELSVSEGSEFRFGIEGDKAELKVIATKDSAEKRAECIDKYRREILSSAIGEEMPRCEALTGLCCREWRIRDMKTRWGSCNVSKGNITLNLRLTEKSPEFLRYVILHELMHLKVPNHSKLFYNELENYCPDWKELRHQLNTR